MRDICLILFMCGVIQVTASAAAQDKPATAGDDATTTSTEPLELPEDAKLVIEPESLTLDIGETATLTARVEDAEGNEIEAPVIYFSRARRSVTVNAAGEIEAIRAGEHTIVALVPKDPEAEARRAESLLRAEIEVTVPDPPIASVAFADPPGAFYTGTLLSLSVEVTDSAGVAREDVEIVYGSSAPTIATADRASNLHLLAAGSATITATAGGVSTTLDIEVVLNPIESFKIAASATEVRTGDVVRLTAQALDGDNRVVPDVPVTYAVTGRTHREILGAGASAHVSRDGRFVAERSGQYTVIAVAGSHTAIESIKVNARNIKRDIEVVGHAPIRDRHTSDLWVWEGPDGNDYAIVGTWGADGHAYIYDVTHPESMSLVDVVHVDARTVNDVKVSEDGRTAIISREGASNRKNGIVILDVSEPKVGVRIIANYDTELSGGVHNLFIHENHVYPVNNGRRYDIVNIGDPTKPSQVGRFELTTPGHGVHDVWIEDGIAYSSNWYDGIVVVDLGGGGQGGTPEKPVELGRYNYPSGWNHAAYPFRSESTDHFYVVGGDEAFPYGGLNRGGGAERPNRAAGWLHFIQWDDWDDPQEVARYQVPEAGSHNFWIEGDVLYAAFYNGGLRVIDISGELMGNLYDQGREIGFWIPNDPEGYVPNAPFSWGPQPHKGHIFLADWNSGLWALKLGDEEGEGIRLGEPH